MFKIGYKVVESDRSSWTVAGRGQVKYPKNRWAKPAKGCGPLCVFATWKQAWDATFSINIVACVYIPTDEKSVWTSDSGGKFSLLPAGTRLASAVMCLE